MSSCQYRYNPSEIYKRTAPGTAPETQCGARTYPAVDEPELAPYPRPDGGVEIRKTGRLIQRGQDDPYCPAHGGTQEPPPPPVTTEQLQDAYESYVALAQRYGHAVPAAVPDPYEVATGQLPAGQTPAAALTSAVQASQAALGTVVNNVQQ